MRWWQNDGELKLIGYGKEMGDGPIMPKYAWFDNWQIDQREMTHEEAFPNTSNEGAAYTVSE